ncbi:hypothetical protein GF362_06770 [Candidatus Dojkabacteria bacterium]|nr:hypothetical protein [Candidatus Dojkabacteria bacterium]
MEQENLSKHLRWILPTSLVLFGAGCAGATGESNPTPDTQLVEPTSVALDPNGDEDGDGLINANDTNPYHWDTEPGLNLSEGLRVGEYGKIVVDTELNPNIPVVPGENPKYYWDHNDISIDHVQNYESADRTIFTIGGGEYTLTQPELERMVDETTMNVFDYIEEYTGIEYGEDVVQRTNELVDNADISVAVYNKISFSYGAPMIPANFYDPSEACSQNLPEDFQEGEYSNEQELSQLLEAVDIEGGLVSLPPLGCLLDEMGVEDYGEKIEILQALQGSTVLPFDGGYDLVSRNTGFVHDPDLPSGQSLDLRRVEPDQFLIRIIPEHTRAQVFNRHSDYPYTPEQIFELTLENELVSGVFRSLVLSLEPQEQDLLLGEMSEALGLDDLSDENFMFYIDTIANGLSSAITIDRLYNPEDGF